MLRFSKIIATAFVAFAVATPALAKEFTLTDTDGTQYRYSSKLVAGDKVAISGTNLDTGSAIDLILDAQGHVAGTVGSGRVKFVVPLERRNSIVASLKGDEPLADASTGPALASALR